ncbi:MAG: DUF4389 domain-containing protein [Nanoarchaeota archaeon]
MVKKGERKEAWFRIVVAIVTGIILNVWQGLIAILALINWFIVVFSGKRNKSLAEFSEYFNTELYKFSRYITFVSNRRPFPFSNLERMSRFQ